MLALELLLKRLNSTLTLNAAKAIIALLFVSISAATYSQSFTPSQQQIEQFKKLPLAQQQQIAQQMGFDISLLRQSKSMSEDDKQGEIDFIQRDIDSKQISEELSKQSIVGDASKALKPFGFDIFEARTEAISSSDNTPVPSNYIMGPGDSVKLELFGKESGQFELEVTNDGSVNLPGLGPLQVAGVSFQELKNLIREKFEQNKIGVTSYVSMGQLKTIQIFLVGEVYKPGPLVISSLSTITSALINSGGVSEIGSLRNIELKRNGKTIETFDFYDLIVKGDTSKDIRLEQGDVLFVPTAQNIVSIDGQIRRPAIYELTQNETAGDLLALAGGLLPDADSNSLQLVRSVIGGGLTITNIDANNKNSLSQGMANGDFLRAPRANLEFSNAIIVSGAINLPNIIADTADLKLSDTITKKTLLINTDVNYALILRKQRFDQTTTVIQFKPIDVLRSEYDFDLQAFDELVFFNRVASETNETSETSKTSKTGKAVKNNNENQAGETLVKGNLKTAQEELKVVEAEFLQEYETDRFKTDTFTRKDTSELSRKELLSVVISRLKSEASESNPLQLIEVVGQVKYPGVYPLPMDVSLEKVLNAAGGLTESAHLENAEISSLILEDGVSNIQHKQISLLRQLVLPESQQVKFRSKDVLNVVRIPQWFENNTIELKGEVVFPGIYQISERETLSSVIDRAGGLTANATIKAAVFAREELKLKEKRNIDKSIADLREKLANNNLSNSQFSRTIDYESATQVLNDLTNVEPLGRMVIDLAAIVENNDAADIQLKNGDVLTIPNVTPAISIIGEVFVSTTYRFDNSLSINDYIDLAGGVREFGDASKLYIVKANGSVFVPESNFWFTDSKQRALEPGDTIVVPRDVTNYESIGLWQGITQIVYQTAVALAAIGSL